ncbi:Nuclear LIM interactor-interacting factor 1 [Giardia duodenalis assemblage B]|uniref:Nuclear LIM interactor-interacting factor 1 n=1 Tax=Giardia duodenalis assemblage B TaxID=1394984 RepID=A0A132NMU2_GIAIN|nr:Nuclear LIM interactor-interacting factor 1 [Giardia intestinalis assemblage B]
MMTAAVCRHVDVVRLLAEEEGSLKDSRGRTALMHAAHNKHPECVRLLLEEERGQKSEHSQTAFILAAQNGKDEPMQLLMKHEDGVSGRTRLIHSAISAMSIRLGAISTRRGAKMLASGSSHVGSRK